MSPAIFQPDSQAAGDDLQRFCVRLSTPCRSIRAISSDKIGAKLLHFKRRCLRTRIRDFSNACSLCRRCLFRQGRRLGWKMSHVNGPLAEVASCEKSR
jgi:hypothetical protein